MKPTPNGKSSKRDRLKERHLQLQEELKEKKRELKIETALEKVRARTMAMRRSDELSAVGNMVFRQIKLLGIHAETSWLWFIDLHTDKIEIWTTHENKIAERVTVLASDFHTFKRELEGWKKKKPFLKLRIPKQEAAKVLRKIFNIKLKSKKEGSHFHLLQSRHKFGFLGMGSWQEARDEDVKVCSRFAKVFEQTYTRFLDLQKAEAQAREAQIEVALERIRSRSMGMHHSDELRQIIALVYQELTKLDFSSWFFMLRTRVENEEGFTTWLSTKGMSVLPEAYYLPPIRNPIHQQIAESWNKQVDFKVIEFGGLAKKKYDNLLFKETDWKNLPEVVKNEIRSHERTVLSFSSFEHIGLQVAGDTQLPKEKAVIVTRFAKVFEQTYTRFLDLQKAEAQAREAQIEAALERVRARAMGLRESNELKEVIAVIYKELSKLGLTIHDANIAIEDPKSKSLTFWGSGLGGVEMPPKFTIPFIDNKIFRKLYYDWDRSVDYHAYFLKGKEFKDYWQILFEETEVRNAPESFIEAAVIVGQIHLSQTAINNGFLEVASDDALNEDNIEILKRFGSVVDMTYRRFHDIQKAEAQAREAEIELALERVRARTMAMQHSGELQEAATLLFQQLNNLGIETGSCGFNIWDKKNKAATVWVSSPEGGLQAPFNLPHTKSGVYKKVYQAMERGEDFFVLELEGNPLKKHFDYLTTLSGIGDVIKKLRKSKYSFPRKMVYHFAFFNNGYLSFHTHEPVSNTHDIFKRFAKVFQQTYTRFLDLQKAEAQAREAQIEAALERVRARTMAMHKSEELNEVAFDFFNQLHPLGIAKWGFALWLVDEVNQRFEVWFSAPTDRVLPEPYSVSIKGHPVVRKIWAAYKNKSAHCNIELANTEKREWDLWLFENSGMKNLPDAVKDSILSAPYVQFSFTSMRYGLLDAIDVNRIPDEQLLILQRFAKVYEQTYTRFLDLQKAEAQAREAQIEAALERVRARSMAMHKSDELLEAASLLYNELLKLGISSLTSGYALMDEDEKIGWSYMSNQMDGTVLPEPLGVPHQETDAMRSITQSWKKQEPFHVIQFDEEGTIAHQTFIAERTINFNMTAEQLIAVTPKRLALQTFNFKQGYLLIVGAEPLSKEQIDMLIRFTRVFEMTYQRFLDLQKAEAQAREAQIEVALERVRAAAMGMHHSDEISEVLSVLFSQFDILGISPMYTFLSLIDLEKNSFLYRQTGRGGKRVIAEQNIDLTAMDVWAEVVERWKAANYDVIETMYVPKESVPEVFEVYKYIYDALPEGAKVYPEDFPEGIHATIAASKFGHLGYDHFRPSTEEEKSILLRFNTEFVRLYQRSLDLQKAEAQAREAQIEVALERVRAKAMAMHNSGDLSETIKIFYKQIGLLGENPRRCGIDLIDKETQSVHISSMNTSEKGETIEAIGSMELKGHWVLEGIYNSWIEQKEFFPVLQGMEIKEYYDFVRPYVGYPDYKIDTAHHGHFFSFSEGCIYVWTTQKMLEDQLNIYRRFTSVLSLTYRRYKDLKEAEAQAREAQIEASLERVRSRSMAMHNSNELAELVSTVFKELTQLDFELTSCIIWIHNHESGTDELWVASSELNKPSYPLYLKPFHHGFFNSIVHAWKAKDQKWIFPLTGSEKIKFQEAFIKEIPALPEALKKTIRTPDTIVFSASFNSIGALEIVAPEALTDKKFEILHRFGRVFDLSYTRFNDLKKAEAQAREAQIEAALERVRAKAMAMHGSQDLADTIGTFYKQLQSFNLVPRRCGVGLLNKENKEGEVYTWNTTEGGESLELVGKIKMEGHPVLQNVYNNWITQTEYHPVLKGKEIKEYYEVIRPQVAFPDYQQDEVQYGYFFMFEEGGVYAWTETPLKEDELKIYRRFTSVLSLTYKRYKDLKIAEAHAAQAEQDLIAIKEAKQKAEAALTELQTTQKQLIQSEKMASLGELTAGIAHEIQNPLNFVNNFSEVSKELLDEMKEEIEKGNNEEVMAIALDVIQNLEKINHHGKRADGIVKGMLQHSRSNSGTKEPTDINMLADEYLRLAYHGLRAKDKSFNATMKTEFDESLEKINVIPQDIGRVILNLITNAFYAVTDKKKLNPEGFEPMVTVSTKNEGDKIVVRVKDNGNGIPQNIVDKIFQPFFTTKPTGQGTGLGLSLSYDIVMAHGGELTVESTPNEQTEFIIILPYT